MIFFAGSDQQSFLNVAANDQFGHEIFLFVEISPFVYFVRYVFRELAKV